MGFKIFMIISWTILSTAGGLYATFDCSSITVNCPCDTLGNQKDMPQELQGTKTVDLDTFELMCSGFPNPCQACGNTSSLLDSNNIAPGESGKNLLDSFYPEHFVILPGEVPEKHRFGRQLKLCRIKALERAALYCETLKHGTRIECRVVCTYGSAVRTLDGVKTVSPKLLCDVYESIQAGKDVWTPHEIRDCEPYLNCKVTYQGYGHFKCVEPFTEPAYCDISCMGLPNWEPVPLKRYPCVDENYGKTLPRCAKMAKAGKLIEKPDDFVAFATVDYTEVSLF